MSDVSRKIPILYVPKDGGGDQLMFLSNKSYTPFELPEGERDPVTMGVLTRGKRWRSVDHYLEAKKYEGTQLEEKIRRAKTLYQAKSLGTSTKVTRSPSSGVRKKEMLYPVREDWDEIREAEMEKAVTAKFNQNPEIRRKLLETGEMKLVDKEELYLGSILERVREMIRTPKSLDAGPRETKREKAERLEALIDSKDVTSSTLTEEEAKVVNAIIRLSERVRNHEGHDYIYFEMVEDAIVIFAENVKLSLGYIIDEYLEANTEDNAWGDIFRYQKNFHKLINNINDIFSEIDPFQKSQVLATGYIALFIKWMRRRATKDEIKAILKATDKVNSMKLVFPKKKRWYRSEIAKKKGKKIGVSRDDSSPKAIKPSTGGISKPAPSKPSVSKSEIEEIEQTHKLWLYGKIRLYVDSLMQISKLLEFGGGDKITTFSSKDVDVVSLIYGCNTIGAKLTPAMKKLAERNVNKSLQELSKGETKYSFDDSAIVSLAILLDSINRKLLFDIKSAKQLSQKLREIDRAVNERIKPPSTVPKSKILLYFTVKAIQRTLAVLSEKYGVKITQETIGRAFLTITPQIYRTKARIYFKDNIETKASDSELEDVGLSSDSENSSLILTSAKFFKTISKELEEENAAEKLLLRFKVISEGGRIESPKKKK